MKLFLGDVEYDVNTSLNDASLTFVKKMAKACGFGPKTLAQRLQQLTELDDPSDMVEDPELMDVFCALVWIVRTHAGENLTLDEAADVPLSAVRFVYEDGDEVPDAGRPTRARTASRKGSAPGGARAKRTTTRSKTSRRT